MRVTIALIAILCVFTLAFGAKNKDMVGTWQGVANIPEDPPRVEFTITFSQADGVLKGVVQDDMGFADQAPIKDFKIDKDSFSCSFVTTDYMAYRIKLTGKYDKKLKKLSGKLEVPAEGVVGTWEAIKKVEKKEEAKKDLK